MALRPCLTMQGSGPEPGPTQGATRAAWVLRCRTQTRYCVRAWSGLWPALFAHSASYRAGAPAPALVRSGAARPPPLRGPGPAFAPSLRSPGPPPGASPPAPPLGVRRGAPSPLPSPLAAAAARALPSLRCGLPVRSPLLRLGRGPWASRRPAGSPPPRPLRGFGGGWLPPRGPARPSGPLVSASGPRGFVCAPAPARACWRLCRGVSGMGWALPCAPPPRRPRWGLRGAPSLFGASPPLWVALLAPLSRAPLWPSRAPVRPFRPG